MREETGSNILRRNAICWGRRREEEKRGLTRQAARCRAFLWSLTQTCRIFYRSSTRLRRFLPVRSQRLHQGR